MEDLDIKESLNKNFIGQIKLEGFKSIKKMDLEMRPINILLGANGAGKSNFISIFTFLKALSEGRFQPYIIQNGGAEHFLFFGSKETQEIDLKLKFFTNIYNLKLGLNFENNLFVFLNESLSDSKNHGEIKFSGRNDESGLLLPLKKTDKTIIINPILKKLKSHNVFHFHDVGKTSPINKFRSTADNMYLESDGGNIASFLLSLQWDINEGDRQCYEQIRMAVQSVAPYFYDFHLGITGGGENEITDYVNFKWIHTKDEKLFSFNALSDGTARFILLATLLLQPAHSRPSTIIIDEPELGLHPAALNILADIIKSVSNEVQVICSTQSTYFANLFEPEDFIITEQIDGASTFKRVEREELEVWLEDYQMGDLWNKNLIGGRPQW